MTYGEQLAHVRTVFEMWAKGRGLKLGSLEAELAWDAWVHQQMAINVLATKLVELAHEADKWRQAATQAAHDLAIARRIGQS